MERIDDHSDTRNHLWCIHCGETLNDKNCNKDHVPSKMILGRPLPKNTPKVLICKKCNNKFSKDEEYFFVFLNCVISGSTDPDKQKNRKIARSLERSPKLRGRIEKSIVTQTTFFDEDRVSWRPEYGRLNDVIVKNARGHAYFEFGLPLFTKPTYVNCTPLELLQADARSSFESVPEGMLWPEIASRSFQREWSRFESDHETGECTVGDWVNVRKRTYRYVVSQVGGILVRSVIFDYLATEVFWSDE